MGRLKYTNAFKLEVAQHAVTYSITEAATKYGLSYKTVQVWHNALRKGYGCFAEAPRSERGRRMIQVEMEALRAHVKRLEARVEVLEGER